MNDPAVLSGIITGVFGLLVALVTVVYAPRLKQKQDQDKAEEERRNSQRQSNIDEASRLREELRDEIEDLKGERDKWRQRHDYVYGLYLELREMFVRARLEILGTLDRAIERLEDKDNPAKLDRGVKLLEDLRGMIQQLKLPPLEERTKE